MSEGNPVLNASYPAGSPRVYTEDLVHRPSRRARAGTTPTAQESATATKQVDILSKLDLLVPTLMPPQARVGDASMVPADAHGCPACPHPAVGPAIQGSPNVLTNGLPSVRVGDAGIHAACCGPNKWNAKTGSQSVLINGRPAHRLGDLVRHCGGVGRSIEGSSNVIVGDLALGSGKQIHRPEEEDSDWIEFKITVHGIPVQNFNFDYTDSSGSRHPVNTGADGRAYLGKVKKGVGCVNE